MLKGKRWFIGYSSTLWLPVSIEGWLVTGLFAVGLYLVVWGNGVTGDVPFKFSKHYPVLLEMIFLVVAFYWITRGRVDKRY